MAATSIQDIRDFQDVIRLLEDHPEWRSELRRVLLSDALLALPDQLARLIEQVTVLASRQAQTEERLANLDERMATLVEAQRHTDERLVTLAEAQQRTDEQLAALVESQRHLTLSVQTLVDDVGKVKGKGLEIHYRLYGSPFFGIVLRRPQVVSMGDLTDLLDTALDRSAISLAEAMEIRRADVIIRGTRREDGTTVYLVVEVSWSVDLEDVERAARRAMFLAKTGLVALPAVAGETIRPRAAELAQTLHVWQITDADVIAPAV